MDEKEYEEAHEAARELAAEFNLEFPDEIRFAPDIIQEIRGEMLANMREGALDPDLSGRMRVAWYLAVLDHRSKISAEDWHWAGKVWQHPKFREALTHVLQRDGQEWQGLKVKQSGEEGKNNA